MTQRSYLLAAVLLTLSINLTASAEELKWVFSIDEQQVRNGPEADGSTNSPGTGSGIVRYDTDTNMLSYTFNWDNLFGDLTKLHIHGAADADSSNPRHILEIFGPPAIPDELATTSGTVTNTFELQTLVQDGFDPIPPAEIIETMEAGLAYLNVHTTVFGMGEIRGNLGVPVPEPASTQLVLCASIICFLGNRQRRK